MRFLTCGYIKSSLSLYSEIHGNEISLQTDDPFHQIKKCNLYDKSSAEKKVKGLRGSLKENNKIFTNRDLNHRISKHLSTLTNVNTNNKNSINKTNIQRLKRRKMGDTRLKIKEVKVTKKPEKSDRRRSDNLKGKGLISKIKEKIIAKKAGIINRRTTSEKYSPLQKRLMEEIKKNSKSKRGNNKGDKNNNEDAEDEPPLRTHQRFKRTAGFNNSSDNQVAQNKSNFLLQQNLNLTDLKTNLKLMGENDYDVGQKSKAQFESFQRFGRAIDYDEDMMNNYLINILSLNEIGKVPQALVVVKSVKDEDPLLMVRGTGSKQ